MLSKRNLMILLIIFCLFSLANCKKQSTTPDMSNLTRPVIWLNLFNMSFAAYETGPNPSSQILQIKNSGPQTLDYTLSADADWVSFSPESGTSTNQTIEHKISINKAGLEAQDQEYTAKITVIGSQAYNNPQEVTVSLKLSEERPPEIWLNNQQLTFDGQEAGSNPDSQTIKIKNSGEGTLRYDISTDAIWLEVNPFSGSSKTQKRSHSVVVDIAGLNEGTYDGTITITDSNAANNPQQVNVTLNLSKKGPPPPPPSTANRVGISISPSSGGAGTTVTITISVNGNTSPISSAFGLNLNYSTSVFQYLSTSKGTLTSSWAAVDGGASGGTLTVGGFRGSGSVISTGSQGSIAVVRLRVIAGSGQTTQITLSNLIDDIAGMIVSPGSVTFTRN
jgi:hypothetical protein